MEAYKAAALSVVIILILVVLVAFLWERMSLVPSSFSEGETLAWDTGNKKDATRLRFRGAVFTVTTPDGKKYTADVTANLNAIAAGYSPAPLTTPAPPAVMKLPYALSAYSFAIKGFNDEGKRVPEGSVATLTTKYRTI